jgi:hypothetical protein
MKRKREIELTAKKVVSGDDDPEDLMYWAHLPVRERLLEAAKWNYEVWKHLLRDKYPEKIERVGGKQNKKLADEDDF